MKYTYVRSCGHSQPYANVHNKHANITPIETANICIILHTYDTRIDY